MTETQLAAGHGRVAGDDGLGLYRRMTFIRRFEEEVHQFQLKGNVPGTTHLCNGHEAVSVGVCRALDAGRRRDRHAPTAGTAHALARGVAPEALSPPSCSAGPPASAAAAPGR